jgi:hypothetical protein
MNLKHLFLSLILGTAVASAQTVLMLKTDGEVMELKVSKISDPISFFESKVAIATIDSQFQSISLPDSGFYILRSKAIEAGIQALHFDTLWMELSLKKQRFLYLKGKSVYDMREMERIDSLCDVKLYEWLPQPLTKRIKEIKYFSDTLKTAYSQYPSAWIKDYVFYRTAAVEISLDAGKRTSLMERYFSGSAQPWNYAWNEAFRYLFDGYVAQKLNARYGAAIDSALKQGKFETLFTLCSKDSLKISAENRELAILFELFNLAQDRRYGKDKLTQAIVELNSKTAFTSVRKSATIVLERWERYKKGKTVEDFSYNDSGRLKKFSDLKGKVVYIAYYPDFNQATRRDLLLLKALQQKFNTEMVFLAVINTKETQGLQYASRQLGLGFPVVALSECSAEFELLPESLDAITYLLIDRKGRFLQAPTEGPATDVEASFLNAVKEKP